MRRCLSGTSLSKLATSLDLALRAPVMAWRAELIEIAARLEALIDFSDEDLPPVIEKALRKGTKALITALAENLADGGIGELVRDGRREHPAFLLVRETSLAQKPPANHQGTHIKSLLPCLLGEPVKLGDELLDALSALPRVLQELLEVLLRLLLRVLAVVLLENREVRAPQGFVPWLVCRRRVSRRGVNQLGFADVFVLIEQLSIWALDAEPKRGDDCVFILNSVSIALDLLPVVTECFVLVEVQVTSNEPAGRRLIVHETNVEVLPRYAVQTTMVMA